MCQFASSQPRSFIRCQSPAAVVHFICVVLAEAMQQANRELGLQLALMQGQLKVGPATTTVWRSQTEKPGSQHVFFVFHAQESEMELRDLTVRNHMLQEETAAAKREAFEARTELKLEKEIVEQERCNVQLFQEKWSKVSGRDMYYLRCSSVGGSEYASHRCRGSKPLPRGIGVVAGEGTSGSPPEVCIRGQGRGQWSLHTVSLDILAAAVGESALLLQMEAGAFVFRDGCRFILFLEMAADAFRAFVVGVRG